MLWVGFTDYHSSQAFPPPSLVMLTDLISYFPEKKKKCRDQLAQWTTFPLKPTLRTFKAFAISILSSCLRELGYGSFFRGVRSSAFHSPTLSHQDTATMGSSEPLHRPTLGHHDLGWSVLTVYSSSK